MCKGSEIPHEKTLVPKTVKQIKELTWQFQCTVLGDLVFGPIMWLV